MRSFVITSIGSLDKHLCSISGTIYEDRWSDAERTMYMPSIYSIAFLTRSRIPQAAHTRKQSLREPKQLP